MSRYWAVYPKSAGVQLCRIEKASSPLEAIRIAFGFRPTDADRWLAKDLGTRVEFVRSDNRRIEALRNPQGWVDPVTWKPETKKG